MPFWQATRRGSALQERRAKSLSLDPWPCSHRTTTTTTRPDRRRNSSPSFTEPSVSFASLSSVGRRNAINTRSEPNLSSPCLQPPPTADGFPLNYLPPTPSNLPSFFFFPWSLYPSSYIHPRILQLFAVFPPQACRSPRGRRRTPSDPPISPPCRHPPLIRPTVAGRDTGSSVAPRASLPRPRRVQRLWRRWPPRMNTMTMTSSVSDNAR